MIRYLYELGLRWDDGIHRFYLRTETTDQLLDFSMPCFCSRLEGGFLRKSGRGACAEVHTSEEGERYRQGEECHELSDLALSTRAKLKTQLGRAPFASLRLSGLRQPSQGSQGLVPSQELTSSIAEGEHSDIGLHRHSGVRTSDHPSDNWSQPVSTHKVSIARPTRHRLDFGLPRSAIRSPVVMTVAEPSPRQPRPEFPGSWPCRCF